MNVEPEFFSIIPPENAYDLSASGMCCNRQLFKNKQQHVAVTVPPVLFKFYAKLLQHISVFSNGAEGSEEWYHCPEGDAEPHFFQLRQIPNMKPARHPNGKRSMLLLSKRLFKSLETVGGVCYLFTVLIEPFKAAAWV